MEDNSRALSLLGGLAISIVGFQICRKVFPWIYTNILAPKIYGCSVNLAAVGEWAGESNFVPIGLGLLVRLCHAFPQSRQIRTSRTPRHHVHIYITHTKFELTIPTFAVITGSTDGIGKAYAREVRTQGHYNREKERESESYDRELDLLDYIRYDLQAFQLEFIATKEGSFSISISKFGQSQVIYRLFCLVEGEEVIILSSNAMTLSLN